MYFITDNPLAPPQVSLLFPWHAILQRPSVTGIELYRKLLPYSSENVSVRSGMMYGIWCDTQKHCPVLRLAGAQQVRGRVNTPAYSVPEITYPAERQADAQASTVMGTSRYSATGSAR